MSLRLYPISALRLHRFQISAGRTDLLNELFSEGGSEGDNGRGAAALTRQVSGSVFDRWSVAKKGDGDEDDDCEKCFPPSLCSSSPPLSHVPEVEYFNTDEFPWRLLTGFMDLTLNLKIFKNSSWLQKGINLSVINLCIGWCFSS